MQRHQLHEISNMAISPDERAFFAQLGARIAELRKTHNITQIQMAELLGVSQQTINSYEVGRRRIPVSALPLLAQALSISVDELLECKSGSPAKKRGPTSNLQQRLELLSQLPRSKQRLATEMLDAIIQQHNP